MSLHAKIIQAMANAGASAEVIAAACMASEALAAERRQRNAISQRRRRRQNTGGDLFEVKVPSEHVTMTDPPVTMTGDDSPPLSSSPTPPITLPPVVGGGGGDRPPLVSPKAIEITKIVMKIAGVDLEFTPSGWCGAPMRVQAWLAEGWTEPIIRAGVEAAMAGKHDGPPTTIKFFEKPIAREFARQSAPLPNVVQFQPESKNVRGIHPNTAARDRAIAHLDAIIERESR